MWQREKFNTGYMAGTDGIATYDSRLPSERAFQIRERGMT